MARAQLVIGGKQHNQIIFHGSLQYLSPALRKIISSYFNSWNALRDITRYPELKQDLSEAYGARVFEGTDWDALERLYANELRRLQATFHGGSRDGQPAFRLTLPANPARPLVNLVRQYTLEGGVLRDSFDIWVLDKLLRRAKAQVRYAANFASAFAAFSHTAISFEASPSFFRQIQAFHAPQHLVPELQALLEPQIDAQHTLKDPIQLRALAATLTERGAQVRVLPDTAPLIEHYEALKALAASGGDADRHSVTGVLGDSVRGSLYPFQQEGVAFLVHNRRALLADDMGLGKTMQAICASLYLLRTQAAKRVLVICPASLKYQWQAEIHRFTSERCEIIGGDPAERAAIYQAASSKASLLGPDARPAFYVVNYELVQRDLEEIKQLGADVLIIDEAQRVKNYQTKTYQSILKLEAPYAFVLTGTPLENQLMELYTIMRFIDQRALGANPLAFRQRYVLLDRFGGIRGYQNTAEVSRKLASLVLRRTKLEALPQLPPLIDKPVWLSLTDVQRKIYRELRGEARELLSATAWDNVKTNNAMVLLQRLREVCDTPELIDPRHTESQKLAELLAILDDEVGALGRQAIIFTQWTRMGEILLRELRAAGYEPVFLHGGLDAGARARIIEEFQQGRASIFISTDAGGLGLNLQNASLVVNFDMPFNPAKLSQRISRAWRLGQQNTVVVVNLFCRATVEENLLRILERKRALFDDIFGELSDLDQPARANPEQHTLRELLAEAIAE